MTRSTLRIGSPGLLCTIQDRGRFGYQCFGVSTSGAMDLPAMLLGNRLLGNPSNAPVLEVTFGGFSAEFLEDAVFALSGADLGASLNGVPVPRYQAIGAGSGDRLALVGPVSGFRAYLSIAGGFDTAQPLGSAATHVSGKIGGIDGRALRGADELGVAATDSAAVPGTSLEGAAVFDHAGNAAVRVIPGPQDDHFTAAGMDTLFGSEYTVSDRSNRQGLRLDGPPIEASENGHGIISDAVVTGSIQIPGDGRPIVLLADRQTTGGYPKIGVVATADLPALAQAAPGTSVRFVRSSQSEAVEALREQRAALESARTVPPVLEKRTLRVGGAEYDLVLPSNPRPAGGGGAISMQVRVNGTAYTVSVREEP